MVGRAWRDQFPERVRGSSDEVLRLEGLTRSPIFEDVSFTIHAGEILGLAGLVGSGRTKLCKALFGAAPYESGTIYSTAARRRSTRPAKRSPMASPTSPKTATTRGSSCRCRSRRTSPCRSSVRFAPRGLLDLPQERQFTDEMMARVDVRASGRDQIVATLSGGNQQKVALAKWLSTQSKIFLLDEPTVGIDVGAKSEIYQLVAALAREGVACLLISSEIPEILSLSSRVLVMRKGRIAGELDPRTATEEDILRLAV